MDLKERLLELVKKIGRDDLREIVSQLLENPRITFVDVVPKIGFEEAPAAPRKHHLFPGGLILHTISVAEIALHLCDIVERIYGVKIDRDLVLAAALLHDVFKLYQYEVDTVNGGYRPRDDWYMSHDYALIAELARRGAPSDLIRVSSEVHGTAPITTVEGLIVHLADSLDARLGEVLQNLVLSKAREVEAELGCKAVALFVEAVNRYGVREILRLSVEDPKALKKLLSDLCQELKQTAQTKS